MKKKILAILSGILVFTMLAACGGNTPAPNNAPPAGGGDTPPANNEQQGGETVAAPKDKIVIGIIDPLTGNLAGFGEGADWINNLLLDVINKDGGIYLKDYDATLPVEIIMYDSESDTTKATALTQKLIQEDKVDLVIGRHTPETVNPVAAVCERFETPMVGVDAPIDAVNAEGPYDWVYHAHWTLEQMYSCYKNMWIEAGFEPGSGAKIGVCFANDADGTAWAGAFNEKIKADGYTLVDPGQYPVMTQDYSDIIRKFIAEDVDILIGTNINPDFATIWRQSQTLGFKPKLVTMGKAYLLESDAMAVGPDLMDGLCGEVWWSPTHPFKSALTGETPASLAEKYEAEKSRKITQPMGFKYASMEIVADVFSRAGSLDKDKIAAAIAATDLETIVGPIKYTLDGHYAQTPLVGGQWVKNAEGGLDLFIIDNTDNPNIPTTGEMKPIAYK